MAKKFIRCVIFDMDNTILELNVDWKEFANEINWDFFGGKYSHFTPHQLFVVNFKQLMKKLSTKQQAEVKRRRMLRELGGIPKGKCFPYVYVIAELKKKGYKLAVVSANYRSTVIKALAKCGIDRYIKTYVGIDDSVYSKPSPKPILAALKKLKCKPSEAVYVGDMPDDIRAGKAAGMKTIGVASSLAKRIQLTLAGPDAIIKNVGHLAEGLMKIYN